ncbi:MAG: DUF294 nucleotidyltransferase-like domain-containing protein [Lysobacteraceae bacterium]
MQTPDLDPTSPPFDLLDAAERARLHAAMDVVYFAAGETALQQGASSPAVYVLHRGRMQALRVNADGEEALSEYGPGDLLGAFAVMIGQARFSYRALEQTLCLAIDAEAFLAVQRSNPRFAAWFLEGLSAKRQMLAAPPRPGDMAETMLTRVGDTGLAPLLWLDPQASLREARAGMKRLSVSCALVDDPQAGPGIVTRTDLLDALALDGHRPDDPVAPLVRRPLITVHPDAALFQALVSMTEHRVERVVVADGERALGALGMAEVLSHHASHSHLIELRLERARRVEDVREAALRMTALVRNLHAQGARMGHLTELVSALNGRVMRRLWELIVPAPQREQMCLLALGSEGRREQVLKTDQDNALILPDDFHWPQLEATMQRFSQALNDCGWPPCAGGVMVSNPAWRHSVSGWRRRVVEWSRDSAPQAMIDLAISIDARPVAGDASLFDAVQPLFFDAAADDRVLHHFAAATLAFHTPLSLFGQIKAGDRGADIKKGGIFPLVHGLRTLALKHGVRDRNSFRRARTLAAAGNLDAALAGDVQQALAVFLRMRLSQQLDALCAGEQPGNRLRLAALTRLDRELLRDALAVVDAFKAQLKRSFHL